MSQQAIIDGIYTKLAAVQTAGTVYALTSGRMYDGQAPQDATLPFLQFGVVSDPPDCTFTGDNTNVLIQFDVYGLRSAGAKVTRTIADALYTLLHRATFTISGVTGVSCGCVDRGDVEPEEDAYRVMQQYRIYGTAN